MDSLNLKIILLHTSCSDEAAVKMRLEGNELNALLDVAAAICNRTESDRG